MSIFITGGTGYIGTKTVEVALEQGYPVTALTRDAAKAVELKRKGVKAIVGDLMEDGEWQKEIASAEYVIHLAAPPTWGKKVSVKVAQNYQRGHYDMTIRLLNQVNPDRIKKLIYIAGTSYFGDAGDRDPANERFRSQPKGWGPYIAPSVDVLSRYIGKGLPIVTAFPGQVYGADSWLPQLMLEPLANGKPVIGLKGYNPLFSPIHVRDCARAFLFLMEAGVPGENYILVDDKPLRSKDISTLAAKVLQVPYKERNVPAWLCRLLLGPVLTEYATSHTNFSNQKLKKLGFTYQYPTIQTGLGPAIDEWKARAKS